MASHGIGILHLQGVVVRVCLHLLHPLALHGDVGIIFEDGVEKPVVLCLGQRRRVGMQRIEQHVHFQFKVVIVGKDQRHVCKAEAIQLSRTAHAAHHGSLTVGNEIHLFLLFRPEVVIFRHHQQITGV